MYDLTIIERANYIVQTYIEDHAPHQVNLPAGQKQELVTAVKTNKFDTDTFNRAQAEIVSLMGKDSFARFKQSNLFAAYMQYIKRHSSVGLKVKRKINQSTMTKSAPGSTSSGPATEDIGMLTTKSMSPTNNYNHNFSIVNV